MEKLMGNKSLSRDDNWYLLIIRKIDELNLQNQRLISIADHMMKTSFVAPLPTQPPLIISQIEEDMRASFNALIEGVKEYFIVIDQKLKQIAVSIQQQLLERKPISQQSAEVHSLTKRIENLEQNLRKTQQNESKLISIIEGMTHREINEQNTLLRSKQASRHEHKDAVNHHQSSFRIFSVKEQNSTAQLYPRPYSIVQSDRAEPTPKHQAPSFCFPNQNYSIKSIPMPKRSLKGSKQAETETVNSTHRMSYMMNILKK